MAYTLIEDDAPAQPKRGGYVLLPDAPHNPTLMELIGNASAKGVAGLLDSVGNTPHNIANLGIAAVGAPLVAMGKPQWAPDTLPTPNYAHRALTAMNSINPNADPVNSDQRFMDSAVQGVVGGAFSPANAGRQILSNAALGALSGGTTDLVSSATESPMAGIAAGMLAPIGAAGLAGSGRRIIPNGKASTGNKLLKTADDPKALRDALARSGQVRVPGSQPTTAEVAMQPGLSQAQRNAISMGYGPLTARAAEQNAARVAQLERVAPGATKITPVEAAENAGNVLFDRMDPVYQGVRADVGNKFRSIDPLDESRVDLPVERVRGVIASRYGAGSGGADSDLHSLVADITARQDARDAYKLSHPSYLGYTNNETGAPVSEFQRLRSRATEMAHQARLAGDKNKAATAAEIRNLLSMQVEAAAGRSAMRQVLEKATDYPSAMFRDGIGEVDFRYGDAGTGRSGNGVAHLVRRRNEQGYDGNQAAFNMPEVIAFGKMSQPYSVLGSEPRTNVDILSGDARAVLEKTQNGHWLLTGWDNTLRDGGTGVSPVSVYAGQQPFIQTGQGARSANPSIANGGEYFTPDMARAWREAIDARRTQGQRFETGPQMRMWQTGPDGLPKRQGAETFGDFFNSGSSQASDIDSFNRLILGDSPSTDSFRKGAISDLYGHGAGQNGMLQPEKFGNWIDARGGLDGGGAIGGLFNPEQRGLLGDVNADVRRSVDAMNLGRATGSNTAQNLFTAGALLDSPFANVIAGRLLGGFGTGALGMLRDSARRGTLEQMGPALLDPRTAQEAIEAADKNRLYGLIAERMPQAQKRAVIQGLLYPNQTDQ